MVSTNCRCPCTVLLFSTIIYYLIIISQASTIKNIYAAPAELSCVPDNDLTQIPSASSLRISWNLVDGSTNPLVIQYRKDTDVISYAPGRTSAKYTFDKGNYTFTVIDLDQSDCSLQYRCSSNSGYSNEFIINCTDLTDCINSPTQATTKFNPGDSPKTISITANTALCSFSSNLNCATSGIKQGSSCQVTVSEADLQQTSERTLTFNVTLGNAVTSRSYMFEYTAPDESKPSETGAIVLEVLGLCCFLPALGIAIYLRVIRCRNKGVSNILKDGNFKKFKILYIVFLVLASISLILFFTCMGVYVTHYSWTLGATLGPSISIFVEVVVVTSIIFCYPRKDNGKQNCGNNDSNRVAHDNTAMEKNKEALGNTPIQQVKNPRKLPPIVRKN